MLMMNCFKMIKSLTDDDDTLEYYFQIKEVQIQWNLLMTFNDRVLLEIYFGSLCTKCY